MERNYIANIEYGGMLGNGYGGTYHEQFNFTSEHRANSKANKCDAATQWQKRKGRTGWMNVVTTYLA